VTYTTQRQQVKFGVDIPDISRRGFDDFTNQVGTCSFATLADYDANLPFSYLVQRGQGHVTFLEKTVAGIFEDNIRVKPNLSVALDRETSWPRLLARRGDSALQLAGFDRRPILGQ
jgi:hypothetical protein